MKKRSDIYDHEGFIKLLKTKNRKAYEELVFLEDYTNNKTKILAIDDYGIVKANPNKLLNGKGTDISSAINKHTYFIEMLRERNPKALDLIFITKYNGNANKILVMDEFGLCEMTASSLLSGRLTEIRNSIDKDKYFKMQLKKKNQNYNKWTFLTKYSGAKNEIYLLDEYGILKAMPTDLLAGKNCNIMSAIDKTSYWLNMCKDKRIDKCDVYNYDKFIYKLKNTKSIITCLIHGDFIQTPDAHTSGCGCPQCSSYLSGYDKTSWLNLIKHSNYYDSYKLYKIKCFGNDEVFYKIGITSRKISERFTNSNIPYDYEVIEIIESEDGEYIWNLEKELHLKNKNNKYVPKLEFGGMYECFTALI